MSDEQQPELRWAPIPPKPSRAKRVWLIAGIVLAALIISIIVFIALLPHGEEPDADGTASPSPSATASSTPTPSPTAEPTTEPTAPVETEPPVVDPSVEAFRSQVSGWLGDAGTGLDIIAGSSGQDALSVVDTLREDAQRLASVQPPTSILEQWYGRVDTYSQRLSDLRSAVSAGAGVAAAIDASRTELEGLNALVGL